MEDEPSIDLNLSDGERVAATPDNSTLFSFAGSLAMYNHVFVVRDTEKNYGMYIFNNNSAFSELFAKMLELEYPAHLNLREVAECDQRAFEEMLSKEVTEDWDNGIPEDWA